MVPEEDIRYFSKELKLPKEFIRREIEEVDRFEAGIIANEPDRESDPAVVERIMAECTRRAEATIVPYVRNRYLYESAVIAAMYIFAHDDWESGILPDFYKTARKQAYTALMSNGDFDELLVYTMLRLYRLKDVRSIIVCLKTVNKYIRYAKKDSTYFISDYQQDQLYKRYESVCCLASYKLNSDKSIDLTQKIRLFKHLTKLKNNQLLMGVYYTLFRLYVDNLLRDNLNEGCDDINDLTGYTYFEEYLAKAYTAMDYKLESINREEDLCELWLQIAVEYANWMCIEHTGPIPYNPIEAQRILKFAAESGIEYIASRANLFLQEHFNE